MNPEHPPARERRPGLTASSDWVCLIIRKLRSQTLLFGLAYALLTVGYASVSPVTGDDPVLSFLLCIFATALLAHLFAERRPDS